MTLTMPAGSQGIHWVARHPVTALLVWFFTVGQAIAFIPAVASSWGMSVLWVPMLLAWATKFVMLRYGGLGLYRRALPFFFGVILGECIAGSLWSLLGIFYDIPTYAFWP